MPTNLYGPKDNYDLNSSHVIPALIRKFRDAVINNNEQVILWGDGSPLREFLHVDDLAESIFFVLNNDLAESLYNVGYGEEISIKDLAELIKKITGFKGLIIWDKAKPNGTPRKLLDSSKIISIGWSPKIKLEDGIKSTIKLLNKKSLRN